MFSNNMASYIYVEFILIGCSVLMITNLIDKFKWYLYLSMLTKQVLQTDFIVDLLTDCK